MRKPANAVASASEPLAERCVVEAMRLIAERGVEELSLREVARRLGVSHQAPYKHFPSREHLLAEVVARSFEHFAEFLEARERHGDPHADLGELGLAYVAYASEHPLEYRLMFGTTIPRASAHPTMLHRAQAAFSHLARGIAATRRVRETDEGVRMDALFVWATLHGFVGIERSEITEGLAFTAKQRREALAHVLANIGVVLDAHGGAATRTR